MKQIFLFLLATFVLLSLQSCGEQGNAEDAENSSENLQKITNVKVLKLESQTFSNYLNVTGVVKARNHVEIMVEEGGILRKVMIDKGRKARSGDTLAVLENRVVEATFKQAKASLQQAELDHKSKKILFDKRAISENEYLNSLYALNAAEAALDMAKARYDKLFIAAPLNGLVNNRFYDLGAYANVMTPIFEFIDNDVMKIHAGVAERFMGDIHINSPVETTFDAYPGLKLMSKVSFISRSIDPQNRTFQVEVEIPNRERKFAPQMIANVKILRQEIEDRVVVPLDALIESESGWYVFVANNEQAHKVNIDKLAIYESQVLIDGLQPNQNLIVVGHQNLSDGDPINIITN